MILEKKKFPLLKKINGKNEYNIYIQIYHDLDRFPLSSNESYIQLKNIGGDTLQLLSDFQYKKINEFGFGHFKNK